MSDVRLEPLSAAHLDAVAEIFDDPDSRRFTRIPEPPPDGFFEAWLRRYEDGRADGTREAFAVVDGGGGGTVGIALAPAIDPEGREAELGYVVAAHARGRGVASAALRQLSAWAFERGLLRLELRISAENEASKRVAERCGYRREGVLRSTHLKQGIREDCEIWSLLPGELV